MLRLASLVLIAAAITGTLTIDWVRVVSGFAGMPAGAVAANRTPAGGERPVTDRPVAVKSIVFSPAQPPKAEAPNAMDIAAAKAQLARDLAQPDLRAGGAARAKIQENSGNPLAGPVETANSGAASSDRGRPIEVKSGGRAFDAAESQQLIRRAEELLASGDIAAARLILQRMAEGNEQRAALLLASTYDPLVLEKLRVYAFAADVSKARSWYEKAREMGSPEASQRLEMLAHASR